MACRMATVTKVGGSGKIEQVTLGIKQSLSFQILSFLY